MLMDDREVEPHGTENAVKSMTLDWQMVCDERPWVSSDQMRRSRVGGRSFSNGVKRKLEPDESECESMRRKSKKEVELSSLSSGKKNKKSDGKVYKGKLGKPESREDPRVDRGESGCGGSLGDMVCSLNSSFKIPKRPRDLVRRKKVEVDVLQDDKGVLAEGGKVAVSVVGALLGNGNANENSVTNGESQGTSNGSVIMNGKRKKNSHGHKVNKSESLDLLRHMKRDDLCSFLCNDNLVMKKARQKHRKKNETMLGSPGLTVEAKQSLDVSSRICDDSQDDEENLEANAARMLSSRFDPSCTGVPSGRNSSKVTSENRLSALISHNGDLAIGLSDNKESAVASSDIEARILQPRVRHKAKECPRERRRFYAVVYKDLDAFWVLNRRIKVFWPLDQSWYIGHIIGYDPDKNLHHVKYDDREEELIDLQHERFKLFLFPSEVPGKGRRIISTAQSRKEKHGEITESKEMINGSSMESEPIISWLVRSSNRKSSTIGVKKKKRTLPSVSSHSCDLSKGKSEPIGCLEVAPGLNADSSASGSVLPNNVGGFYNKKPISESCLSNSDRAPIVYFRKRFHRREIPVSSVREGEMYKLSTKPLAYQNLPDSVDSIDFDGDASPSDGEYDEPSNRLSSDELVWDTGCFGELNLIKPIIRLKVCGFDFSSHLPLVTSNIVRWQSDMFMLQYGTLISMWPMIHLEILFVDNVVGLWFLIFEGCMKQAVSFVFLVLSVFCQSNYLEMHDNEELPVTSIRFRFSGLHYLEKGLVFLFFNFSQLEKSKWSFLNKKLKKRCILTKELSPSDCSVDNIEALRNDYSQLNLTNISQKHFSEMNLRKRSRHCETHSSSRPSACFKLSRVAFGCDKKLGRLAPFTLLYATAHTFFFSLHLRLLMEGSKSSSSFRNQGSVYMLDHPENELTVLSPLPVEDNSLVLPSGISELDLCSDVDFAVKNVSVDHDEDITTKPSHVSQDSRPHLEKVKSELNENEQRRPTAQSLDPDYHICNVDTKMKGAHLNGLTVDIQSFVPVSKDADIDVQNIEHSIDAALDTNDEVCSPNPTTSLSSWGRIRNGNSYPSTSANLSPGWVDRKQDILQSCFGHGPKRPRTQVSYSLPLGGQEYNSKSKFHQSKGFSHKRIRRASEKKTCEAFGTCQRNVESLCCEANILVTVGDRGWREFGAKIVIELFDHNEWRLAAKISGVTRYSYKAHQFVQPGTTNRYTHAMMWKGGKDWILEFTDRSQWTTFKEMHEECCNRNFRAASVKNIPIPGVRLVEENDDNVPEVPYMRPSSNYHRQDETDIDIAMDPSRVLYDMDSDDERWIMKHRDSDFNESGCGYVSDEMFERTIDVLEKLAYTQQRESFTLEELDDATAEIGPLEAIEIMYEHWREKRQKKGMPLVRYLQPPLWEKYQQQVKEWEQAVAKSNMSFTGGCQEKPSIIEKPPMFAFCLKPRGMDTPNRGSKQRSQKKLPVGALSNGVPGDADAYHSLVGRRLNPFDLGDDRVVYTACYLGTSDSSPVLQGSTRVFSPRDSGALGYFSLNSDGYETNHVTKLYRNKSKKLCLMSSSNNQLPVASYSHRTPGRRSSVHLCGSSEWPSQMHCQLEGYYRQNFEPLDPTEIEEFRLRDASSAARHAVSLAKMKRENAQRMLCRADLAMHKAVAAIMTAEAVKASYKDPNSDVELSG